MAQATFSIRRGGRETAEMVDYRTDVTEGMVVLDAVHQIQAESAGSRLPLELQGGQVRFVFG